MNDYYDVSIKEWRLKEIETVASEHPESSWKFIKGNIADRRLIDQFLKKYNPSVDCKSGCSGRCSVFYY